MTTFVVRNKTFCLLPVPHAFSSLCWNISKAFFLHLWVCCGGYSVFEENTSLSAFHNFCSFITSDLSALDTTITKTKRSHATSLLFAFLPATQVESGSSSPFLINLNSIQSAIIYCPAMWSPKIKYNSHIIKQWNGYYMSIRDYLLHYNFTPLSLSRELRAHT